MPISPSRPACSPQEEPLHALLQGPRHELHRIPYSLLLKLICRKCLLALRAQASCFRLGCALFLVVLRQYGLASLFLKGDRLRAVIHDSFLQGHPIRLRLCTRLHHHLRRSRNQASEGCYHLGTFFQTTIGYIALLGFYVQLQHLQGRKDVKNVLFFDPEKKIANRHLLDYLIPFFEVVSDPAERSDARRSGGGLEMCNFLEVNGRWEDFYSTVSKAQTQWETSKKPLLSLREEDIALGWETLASLGIPQGSWFVTLHVRESGFYQGTASEVHESFNGARNSNLTDYLPAVREITSRGGYVVRIGDPTMQPCPSLPGLIDYARSPLKSERMDVFFLGAPRFFLGTNSGPFAVPCLFDVPLLLTNWHPLSNHYGHRNTLLLPRLVQNHETGRVLTFRELLRSRFAHAQTLDPIPDKHSFLPNTEEEILEATRDMLTLLDGQHQGRSGEKAKHLQARFAALCKETGFRWSVSLPDSFLLAHAELLD